MSDQRVRLSELESVFASRGQKVFSINGIIYDFTKFAKNHPGGEGILEEYIYKDATDAFIDIGHSANAIKLLDSLKIGSIETKNK